MKYRKLTAGVIAGAAALLAGLGSGVVQAAPVKPAVVPPTPVTTQSVVTTLPIMGAPLKISFTTGPGGVLTSATIDPAGGTATASPNNVQFTTVPDSTGASVKVSVKTKGNAQSINARVDSLAKLEGTGGTWTGIVFGTLVPAVQDTVTYTISDTAGNGTGDPIVTIDPPTIADGSTAVVTPSVLKVGEEGQKTSFGQVIFTDPGKTQTRTLTIAASVRTFIPEVENDDDNATTTTAAGTPVTPPAPITVASLRITLSGVKALPQDLASLVGHVQTYNTFLCDSTPASFGYTVDANGNLALDPGTPIAPPTTDVKVDGNKLDVRWPTGERVRLQAKVNGTQVTIQVRERIRCKGAPDPTITGATVVPGGGHHGDHGGNGNGKGNGGGGDD
jgi:hypothetical protein